jgi:hypothetical protein
MAERRGTDPETDGLEPPPGHVVEQPIADAGERWTTREINESRLAVLIKQRGMIAAEIRQLRRELAR